MLRLLFSFALVAVCAHGDIITACCGHSFANPSEAFAEAVGANVSALAEVQLTYTFEILSAPGPLRYEPCLAASTAVGGDTGANATASLLGFGISGSMFSTGTLCDRGFAFSQDAPDVGDVITTTLNLFAEAGVGPAPNTATADASLRGPGFRFFDLQGNPVTNVEYSFQRVIAPVPEPVLWPVILASIVCVFWQRRSKVPRASRRSP